MAFTIQQLISPVSAVQFRSAIVSSLVGLGIPANQWLSGGVFSTILTIISNTLAAMSTLVSNCIQGFFLPTATGGGLQLLAQYFYGIPTGIMAPTAATGQVTLTNSGGGVYTVAAGALTVGNAVTGATYTNTLAFSIPPQIGLTPGSVTVTVSATVLGIGGNAAPNQITIMVTAFLGVTVNNAAPLLGQNTISDAALRALCFDSLAVTGNAFGPRDAYSYAVTTATNPDTGAFVNINRSTVSISSHTGTVTVYVAGPDGTTNPRDVVGVENNINLLARPDGVTVNVLPATVVDYVRSLVIYCIAPVGTSNMQVQVAAADGLATFFSNYPIGGLNFTDDADTNVTGLSADAVIGAIATSIATVGATLTSVSGFGVGAAQDVVMTVNQVLVDELTITANVRNA